MQIGRAQLGTAVSTKKKKCVQHDAAYPGSHLLSSFLRDNASKGPGLNAFKSGICRKKGNALVRLFVQLIDMCLIICRINTGGSD